MLANDHPCLALAADFTPEGLLNWRDALTSVLANRAYVVENYDHHIASPTQRFQLPAIIARRNQSNTLYKPAAFTRANVFLAYSLHVADRHPSKAGRTGWRCALCGEIEHDTTALSFEHVIPQSRGGLSDWKNVALAHSSCNGRKGNRTLAEAGLHLHVRLHRPTNRELAALRVRRQFPNPPDMWKSYLDVMYWTSPIEP